jgi:hypothetical protein
MPLTKNAECSIGARQESRDSRFSRAGVTCEYQMANPFAKRRL